MKIYEDKNILTIEVQKEEIFSAIIKLLNYMRVEGLNYEEIIEDRPLL